MNKNSPVNLELQQYRESLSRNNMNSDMRLGGRDIQQVQLSLNNTTPIRILMYTDSLDPQNDPNYSCTQAGAVIQNAGASYTCTAEDVLSASQKDYLVNNLLSKAKEILSSTLYLEALTQPIQVASCPASSPITVPSTFNNPGVADIDLVVLVTARPIQTQGVLAFGFNCQTFNGRTVTSQLNFNPKSVIMEATKYNFNFGVALHELSHVLGFNEGQFNTAGIIESYSKTITSDGSSVNARRIISPKVLAFAKAHFGCPQLTGVELEDQGGGGTADSHWEKRIFNNEYMTGTASHYPIFSNLTLALFEDLGYYAINHQYAQQLVWGYGLGCSFCSGKCSSWGNSLLYCTEQDNADDDHCSYDRVAKAACSVKSQSGIPAYYQWAGAGKGGDELPDFCPFFEGYSNEYCVDDTIPDDQSLILKTFEVYGNTSRCFVSSLLKNAPSLEGSKARCYPQACQAVEKLKIKVASFWYDCPYGESIKVEGFTGELKCPDGNELCINVPTDNTWPIFTSIEPSSGGPGDKITITGENFNNSTYVEINEILCEDVVVLNSTYLTCTISEDYADITNLIEQEYNVYVVNQDTDKNDVGTINFKIPPSSVLNWAKSHWYIILIGALVVVGAVVFIWRCCCSSRKTNRSSKLSRV
ncbi:hypothetical protein DLAC_09680 [Tieghemostelium lacteum]|uniref:IPT/TIG domain-containing protein n=1 Tax=Tieghemostelium lacteum TaxID=361077 RepID=A0A151Z6X4_TIELA|nr:hypothetical protein DLAC_09680 [Tieghemostelium lacteum]|eukprot:KYQ89712.1 hypothetical protein DLAC_09680 [Tieghemostelium lacteum]